MGSICINFGNNLQSLGMAQLEIKQNAEVLERSGKGAPRDEDQEFVAEIDTCQSPVWIAGTAIFLTGSVCNFSAFAFAPQSILASLEGIQFVTNVLFGKLVLGLVVTDRMYAGTVVTIGGVILTVFSASVVGTLEADFADLMALWLNPAWILYLLVCAALGVTLQATHKFYERAEAAGASLPHSELVLPVTYATFSALFGTLNAVFAKILSELITLQIEQDVDIFFGGDAWFTWVSLVACVVLSGVWLFRMNEALGLYDPLFIIPLLQVNFILFAIVSGGIYFQEFSYFEPLNWCGFLMGIGLLIAGIYLLSPDPSLTASMRSPRPSATASLTASSDQAASRTASRTPSSVSLADDLSPAVRDAKGPVFAVAGPAAGSPQDEAREGGACGASAGVGKADNLKSGCASPGEWPGDDTSRTGRAFDGSHAPVPYGDVRWSRRTKKGTRIATSFSRSPAARAVAAGAVSKKREKFALGGLEAGDLREGDNTMEGEVATPRKDHHHHHHHHHRHLSAPQPGHARSHARAFRFGAVAGLNDPTHDHLINRAL